ncbi:DUF1553 domain-containing protein [Algoriphagus namhaensis]
MKNRLIFGSVLTSFLGVLILISFWKTERRIDFSTQVKPILNTHCISCHGGVKKNGGFSMLFEQEALGLTESGKPAIIPGDPANSELIRRLTHADPELRMPYQRSPLSEEEITILKEWIKQGAKWGRHWAYEPVKAPKLEPSTSAAGFNPSESISKPAPIDFFVQKKLDLVGLSTSPAASKSRLLRRVAFDLTGLPPSEDLAESFLREEISYEDLVDKLLSQPSFGEKWATWWLDLARHADTKGYERDVSRTMWPFRDWVICSLNEDKPFDQFTLEQLAGDLLPNPTHDQLVATAFHRNTMNNDEGGTQDEEFRVAAVLDRVNTTYEVWQSTTMACVQCHSHPYDPIRMEEYYESVAFFNNSRDEDTHDEEPRLRFYEEKDQMKLNSILEWAAQYEGKEAAKTRKNFLTYLEPKYPAHGFEDFYLGELIDTKWLGLQSGGSAYLRNVTTKGADLLLVDYWSGLDGSEYILRKDGPEGEILAKFKLNKTKGETVFTTPMKSVAGVLDLYLEAKNPNAKPQQNLSTIVWIAFASSLPGKEKAEYELIQGYWNDLLQWKGTRLPIMIENPGFMQRSTHLFERGNWLLKGEKVNPDTPDEIGTWKKEWPRNRLGLAYYLTSKDNPLTSRTLVNRIWEQLFGRGLVSSLEDMGTQADPPSHPELLDYLAWQVMNTYDWSIKSLIRELVTSQTYKQSSAVSPELFNLDPENKWYARGPKSRLSAEQIRDQALAVSGLLSSKMYGKPVMPPQPEGIWQTVYNGESWVPSAGEDRYRRAIYTFLKRTSPYPSFISFDAGSREVCLSRRLVTNTPLQALVTLNDPVYLEGAYALAENILNHSSALPKDQIKAMYRKIFYRDIPEEKLLPLLALYQESLSDFEQSPESLSDFFALQKDNTSPQQGALTLVANALMNLDEFLTKP